MEERLLDFVSALPLPVVAWRRDASSAEDLASPVVVNQPLKELLRGLEMSSCLTKESSSRLRRLIAGDEDQKINLALQVHDAHLHVQFKVHRAPPLVILTAIPVSSSFDRSPRSSTGTATIIGAVNGRKISLPSPDCRDVWRAAPDSLPPPTSSAPIFSLRNSPMTRQHFARLASDAPIGLFFCNLQLEVIWVNDRWVELVGECAVECRRGPLLTLTHQVYHPTTIQTLGQLGSSRPIRIELSLTLSEWWPSCCRWSWSSVGFRQTMVSLYYLVPPTSPATACALLRAHPSFFGRS